MPHKYLGRLIRVVALLTLGLASTLPVAQAQQAAAAATSAVRVTARNATAVTVTQGGSRVGEIRKVDGVRWIEFDAAGNAVFKYDEVKRDDNVISLLDHSRGVTLQLDLKAKRVTSTEAASRRRDALYDIQLATAEPVKVHDSGYFEESGRQAGPLTTRERAAGAVPPPREVTPPFCWTDVFNRSSGTIPGRVADCPQGYTLTGGACKRAADTIAAPSRAADCPEGYKNSGNACERPAATKANTNTRAADCPEGFTNTGGECFRLSAPNPLPASSMTCKGGETKIESRCYRGCEAGFNSSGTNCVRPASTLAGDSLSCKAGYQKNAKGRCIAECASGYTNTGEACVRAADSLGMDAMVCKAGEVRNGGRCFPANGKCAAGEVLQGGLCYSACPAGSDGFGTACMTAAPKSWAQCGMGAAKDAAACSALSLDPVSTVRQLALVFGMNSANLPQAGRAAALQKKFKELNDAFVKAKDQPKLKKARDDWEQANGKSETVLSMDKMAATTSEDDMMRYAAQLVAITDAAGPFETPAYPKCSKLPAPK